MTWMITSTGREHHFSGQNLFEIDPEQNWLIVEIAHALSQINRFTGHATRPYSVAEHSLLVADFARMANASASAQLAALLHDAHEAFTGDVSSPVKWHIGNPWSEFEHGQEIPVQNALRIRCAAHAHRARIRQWDLEALATERRDLLLYDPLNNKAWQVLDNPAHPVRPSAHHRLNTPEREAMTWRDWRDEFLRQFNDLQRAMQQGSEGRGMRGVTTITHHSRLEERHPALSEERKLVEAVLNSAAEALTPVVIASRAGLQPGQVTIVMQRLRHDGFAINVGTPGKPRWRARSLVGSAGAARPGRPARITASAMGGTYDGAELRPFDGRPGAMDFKKWPSRGL